MSELPLTLRGVPDSARPSVLVWVLLLVPVIGVSGYLAWMDGTAIGLGLALLGPAAAALVTMASRFFQGTATRLELVDGELRLVREGGLGTDHALPVEDVLDFRIERGAGRYNQLFELWTRTGPVPIHAGGHTEAELQHVGKLLVRLGEQARG